jgi:GNAT superfamily N-acetyltransferase
MGAMSDLEVLPVTSRRERKAFLQLPWKLYENDPHWIPPFRRSQKELVGLAPHPFYDKAEGKPFLAVWKGEPAGRVLAIVNHAHNEYYQTSDGFFGFFEAIDNSKVANGLLTAAREWLIAKGMTTMRGPVNPSLNYPIGLLVHGFDSPPCIEMTYNPPYYVELIEQAGYRKLKDAFAFWGEDEMLGGLDKRLEFLATHVIERFDITVRKMNRKRFMDDVRLFLDIYNRSLVNTWGFVPLSDAEVDHMARALKYLILPDLTVIAEIDGKPVGAMLALPDYNPRIREIDGRLFPLGFVRLLRNRQGIKKVRAISTNVVPEYQQWGIGLALLASLEKQVRSWGIAEAEFSWVLEDNHLSRTSLEHGGAVLQKTYRIYEYGEEMPAAAGPKSAS